MTRESMTETPQALFAAATAAQRSGDLTRAAGLYRRILATSRRYPDVLHQLGVVEHLSGHKAEAASLIREAIALESKQPPYFNNLASALIDLGDVAGARDAAARAIALDPSYGPAHVNLGAAYLRAGDPAAAGAAFRRAVALHPENAVAHYWLGRALQDQERFSEAAASYRAVIALAPGFADAYCNLGFVLVMSGQAIEAETHCRRAIALSPTYADAHNNLGYILQTLGDMKGARESYEQALAHEPQYVAAYNNLGNLHKDLGELDLAAKAYRKALEFEPGHARAQFNITDVKTFTARDEDFAAIAAQLAKLGQPPAQARYLHFAMGKALDDLGAHDEAFAHIRMGNKLKRESIQFRESDLLDYLRAMEDIYDAAALARLAGAGASSPAPIFIVGMPRSGTTLVEQILASHSQVHGGGERTDFDAAIAAILSPGSPAERAAQLDPARLRALGEDYLSRLPPLPEGRTRLTDKMPANFMHLGLIRLALPHAKIIHVVRDPIDTCLSCYFKLFEVGQDFTYDLGELGRTYVAYRRLMDHWRGVMPQAIHDVTYEKLVGDMEAETRRLLAFCGLEWESACLDFHKTARAVQTASATQVRKPVYTSSIGRWKHYECFTKPLLTELAKL